MLNRLVVKFLFWYLIHHNDYAQSLYQLAGNFCALECVFRLAHMQERKCYSENGTFTDF